MLIGRAGVSSIPVPVPEPAEAKPAPTLAGNTEPLWCAGQVAAALNVTKRTAQRYLRDRVIVAFQLPGGQWRTTEGWVRMYIQESLSAARIRMMAPACRSCEHVRAMDA
jgi:hypothetical protein